MQYTNRTGGSDADSKHVPGYNMWDGIETSITSGQAATAPNTTLELTLGGHRSSPVAADNGMEHGNCVIHEVVVFSGPLTDAELFSVTASLRMRWGIAAIVSEALPPALPTTTSATVAMHWDASVGRTLNPKTAGSTLVSSWESKVGSPPVILRSSAAGQVAWVRLANGKPGVYIPTGNIMGTELALPSRLLLRSVVFRWMHIFGPRPPAPSLEKKPASNPALREVCCCG